MANKQALRELQSRLAQRLHSARTVGVAASWLALEAGSARLLLPLSHAGEIFPWADVQAVPYTHDWFLGVANLRGGLTGVADLAKLLQVESAGQRSEAALAQCRLVTLNPLLEVNCALLVDCLLGLRTTEAFASSTPPGAQSPVYHGHSYVDLEGNRWQELNLQLLSQTPDFLNISA